MALRQSFPEGRFGQEFGAGRPLAGTKTLDQRGLAGRVLHAALREAGSGQGCSLWRLLPAGRRQLLKLHPFLYLK